MNTKPPTLSPGLPAVEPDITTRERARVCAGMSDRETFLYEAHAKEQVQPKTGCPEPQYGWDKRAPRRAHQSPICTQAGDQVIRSGWMSVCRGKMGM